MPDFPSMIAAGALWWASLFHAAAQAWLEVAEAVSE